MLKEKERNKNSDSLECSTYCQKDHLNNKTDFIISLDREVENISDLGIACQEFSIALYDKDLVTCQKLIILVNIS